MKRGHLGDGRSRRWRGSFNLGRCRQRQNCSFCGATEMGPTMEVVESFVETLGRVIGGILLPYDSHSEVADGGMLKSPLNFFLILNGQKREGSAFTVTGVMPLVTTRVACDLAQIATRMATTR